MKSLPALRKQLEQLGSIDEEAILSKLDETAGISTRTRKQIEHRAIELVKNIRTNATPTLMENFLGEYGLSTQEGVALMCLAEALLRVPDDQTIDELIEDKISPSSWGEHLGQSSSSLVNASTWALMLTGKVLKTHDSNKIADTLHKTIKRLGEPVIRLAVKRAMQEMGHQFVLGQTIQEAVKRGSSSVKKGYTYSYDMLGEAALTSNDATKFFHSYCDAIVSLTPHSSSSKIEQNPGISIKLSALHPRYETSQKARILSELVPRVKELAILAKNAHMGLNIDAEEASRLDLSLDVIHQTLSSPELEGWDGFGVVVQAYSKRASLVIDWLYALAQKLNRKIMVRLVKGAYWDTEIKIAQVNGIENFPVYTTKAATDISYICCAKQLLQLTDRIYPQFATHNAHTVAAILELAEGNQSFEFQRLHGMGQALHQEIVMSESTKCRIYAPVGAHRDLLAYLVRRLLENGANSSFVNQIVDTSVPPELIAADPFTALDQKGPSTPSSIKKPCDLFQPQRLNSKGWDLNDTSDIKRFENARKPFATKVWSALPLIGGPTSPSKPSPLKPTAILNPANLKDQVGTVSAATLDDVEAAIKVGTDWSNCKPKTRAAILSKAADLYEENSGEIFAVLCREAGKTPTDAVSELREAVDFLRYYSSQIQMLPDATPRGLITCISPWNFPLAIFTGQIAAALAAGNGVLAKPAEPTPIIAHIAICLLHKAGVPKKVLQFIPGSGSTIGTKLTSDSRINGVCFTGSLPVAKKIHAAMATTLEPDATFIAETGGLNAMIVDSTALPEQAIRDIVISAFQSAGQRCSALRLLYLQKDIADTFLEMLYGAMDQLAVSNPWEFSTDLGPAISSSAKTAINAYIQNAETDGRLLKKLKVPKHGHFISPSVIQVDGINDLGEEVFGPVLHIATFEADEISTIISDINASNYGLTFGLHTRIDDRVEQITTQLNVGNLYVNRNQIGAIVGSQPFGGEGLSGTGPKAGGPNYIKQFVRNPLPHHLVVSGLNITQSAVQNQLDQLPKTDHDTLETLDLPGPTGESNRLSIFPKGTILCLGPRVTDAKAQQKIAQSMGCSTLCIVPNGDFSGSVSGFLQRDILTHLTGFDAVALWSTPDDLSLAKRALSQRQGAIIPLITTSEMKDMCIHERHICIDTTAAGGNASLLASQ